MCLCCFSVVIPTPFCEKKSNRKMGKEKLFFLFLYFQWAFPTGFSCGDCPFWDDERRMRATHTLTNTHTSTHTYKQVSKKLCLWRSQCLWTILLVWAGELLVWSYRYTTTTLTSADERKFALKHSGREQTLRKRFPFCCRDVVRLSSFIFLLGYFLFQVTS